MIDALTAILAGVDHGAVTGLGDPLLTRDRRGHADHLAEQIGIAHVLERRDVLLRDDEYVNRRLWVRVAPRRDFLVVHHHLRGNLAAPNATENAASQVSHVIASRVLAMRPRSRPPRRRQSQNVAWSA